MRQKVVSLKLKFSDEKFRHVCINCFPRNRIISVTVVYAQKLKKT